MNLPDAIHFEMYKLPSGDEEVRASYYLYNSKAISNVELESHKSDLIKDTKEYLRANIVRKIYGEFIRPLHEAEYELMALSYKLHQGDIPPVVKKLREIREAIERLERG